MATVVTAARLKPTVRMTVSAVNVTVLLLLLHPVNLALEERERVMVKMDIAALPVMTVSKLVDQANVVFSFFVQEADIVS
jgi:hypothetical protein